MNRREILRMLPQLVTRPPARSRTAQGAPYAAFLETTAGNYLLQIQLEGARRIVTKAALQLFPLPGKVTQTISVLSLLRDQTGLIESSDPRQDFFPVIEELGGQLRFVIITVTGPWKIRIRADWWFFVDDKIAVGPLVSAASQLVSPSSTLKVTLAAGTFGLIL